MLFSPAPHRKHLKIGDIEWSPFGIYDATKTGNAAWSGFDIDMIKVLFNTQRATRRASRRRSQGVSNRLGFTYTIIKLTKGANESWTDVIARMSNDVDVVHCSPPVGLWR